MQFNSSREKLYFSPKQISDLQFNPSKIITVKLVPKDEFPYAQTLYKI